MLHFFTAAALDLKQLNPVYIYYSFLFVPSACQKTFFYTRTYDTLRISPIPASSIHVRFLFVITHQPFLSVIRICVTQQVFYFIRHSAVTTTCEAYDSRSYKGYNAPWCMMIKNYVYHRKLKSNHMLKHKLHSLHVSWSDILTHRPLITVRFNITIFETSYRRRLSFTRTSALIALQDAVEPWVLQH